MPTIFICDPQKGWWYLQMFTNPLRMPSSSPPWYDAKVSSGISGYWSKCYVQLCSATIFKATAEPCLRALHRSLPAKSKTMSFGSCFRSNLSYGKLNKVSYSYIYQSTKIANRSTCNNWALLTDLNSFRIHTYSVCTHNYGNLWLQCQPHPHCCTPRNRDLNSFQSKHFQMLLCSRRVVSKKNPSWCP